MEFLAVLHHYSFRKEKKQTAHSFNMWSKIEIICPICTKHLSMITSNWPFLSKHSMIKQIINFADFKSPQPTYFSSWHLTLFDPIKHSVTTNSKIFGDFFHRVPSFNI